MQVRINYWQDLFSTLPPVWKEAWEGEASIGIVHRNAIFQKGKFREWFKSLRFVVINGRGRRATLKNVYHKGILSNPIWANSSIMLPCTLARSARDYDRSICKLMCFASIVCQFYGRINNLNIFIPLWISVIKLIYSLIIFVSSSYTRYLRKCADNFFEYIYIFFLGGREEEEGTNVVQWYNACTLIVTHTGKQVT